MRCRANRNDRVIARVRASCLPTICTHLYKIPEARRVYDPQNGGPWSDRAQSWAARSQRASQGNRRNRDESLDSQRAGHYREVISAALQELRPGIEVFTADPGDLESEFLRLLPPFVICSRLTKRVELDAPVWVELYPDGASHAVDAPHDGSRTTHPSMTFDTLLSILDAI